MTLQVSIWIAYGAIASTLIPLAFFFIYRKGQPKQNLILAISIFISLTFDVIGLIMAAVYRTNILTNNLYFIIAFPAIMWFYHETLRKRSLKILVRIFTISFLLFATISALDQGLNVLNFNSMTLSSILITITSFFFVADLNLMDESNFAKNRFHETNIILNTSLAAYYFSTIVVFALSDYVDSHFAPEDRRYLWKVHNAVHIFKNLGIAVAFYLTAKRSYTLTNSEKSPTQRVRK